MDFLDLLKEKVVIFDGAMGTSIHKYELSLDDYRGCENCPEILVESRPDVIAEIHASYLEAGCDAIETDTFGGSPVVLAEFGLAERAYELNYKAARLARQVASDYSGAGRPRFVSGSLGPTTKLPSLGHISFREMKDAYYQQVSGLVDGGVDVLQFETGQDLLQAKAAIVAMLEYFKKIGRRLPIIVQVTIEAPPIGTMLVGSDISAALATLEPYPVDVIGMNCATGPREMMDPVGYLCHNTTRAVSVLPNAGLPENIGGATVYKLTPDELAESLRYFACELGVNIVGGCCGTTPEHLRHVVAVLGNMAAKHRQPEATPSVSSLYTSMPLHLDPPPLIVAERTNTNGSRKFKQLLEQEDWDGMVEMAREQEREGSHMLDVCTAYVGRDEVRDMTVLIRRLNTELQIPLVIDTTEYHVLEASLELVAGRPIVNSINLEDGEEKMMRKVELIRRFGAATIALTIDESGMAKTAQRKLEVARRIYDLATGAGLSPADLIFDPLTFTLSTGNEDDRKLGLETLEGIRLIKQTLPGVKASLGVSNISFGFDPHIRQILNSVFLHYAVEHGLDMAIVHASKILPLYKIPEEERQYHRKLIFDERTADYDPLFALLDFYARRSSRGRKSERKEEPKEIEEKLKQRIIDGARVGLEKDLDKALSKYTPLDIINNILLDGMKVVGDLFGAGKMQLPFVLQSAETMKAAVSYLEPFMERVEGTTRGTIVLATVKGDVHDIGKNLCDIILTNNGYRVINLGIKQPIDNIIAAALEHRADCIGMSGLLVKSTVIMKENLEILNQRDIAIPVILGGAALTRRYVEEDCQSVYKGPLYYGQDAFDDLRIMESLTNGGKSAATRTPVPERADILPAAAPGGAGVPPAPGTVRADAIVGARPAAPSIAVPTIKSDVARWLPIPQPPFWGARVVDDLLLSEVFQYINETALIRGRWQVRQRDMPAAEFEELLNTRIRPVLTALEQECMEKRFLVPRAVYGYFPCQSEGDDLIVYHLDRRSEWVRFRFPRQDHGRRLCIADFFASVEEDRFDVLPLQIVTMGGIASERSQQLFESNRYTDYLYFHGLSVESAEAASEVIHKRIRAELGFASEDSPDIKRLLNQGYRGTRYSFGYPACPNLEDQALLFELLEPQRIGVSLTEEFQLVPEQSTSALVVIHPEAKYFNITSMTKAR
ncbi:MAG TPA: methionine synthase [Candidatus Obscuribacterales bacterium]